MKSVEGMIGETGPTAVVAAPATGKGGKGGGKGGGKEAHLSQINLQTKDRMSSLLMLWCETQLGLDRYTLNIAKVVSGSNVRFQAAVDGGMTDISKMRELTQIEQMCQLFVHGENHDTLLEFEQGLEPEDLAWMRTVTQGEDSNQVTEEQGEDGREAEAECEESEDSESAEEEEEEEGEPTDYASMTMHEMARAQKEMALSMAQNKKEAAQNQRRLEKQQVRQARSYQMELAQLQQDRGFHLTLVTAHVEAQERMKRRLTNLEESGRALKSQVVELTHTKNELLLLVHDLTRRAGPYDLRGD